MNRILLILLFVITASAMSAQRLPTNIDRMLSQEKKAVTGNSKDVYIEGRRLKDYRLSMYRSVTIYINKTTEPLMQKIEKAVRNDAREALDREIVELGGKLYYASYTLKPDAKGQRRYLFYKNNALKKQTNNIVIIYMEGDATMEEIKQKFGG